VELPRTKVEKEKAADLAQTTIEKKYGAGSVFFLSKAIKTEMPHISTGIYSLDEHVIQIGGIPKGRIVEFYGPEASGKTTLALTVIAAAQKEGGLCGYIDAENALDPTWATKNGVNVKDLLVSQPDSGEEALDILVTLVDSGAFAVLVVDSVSALVPRAELQGEIGDAVVGAQARLMSQALRILSSKVRSSQCVVIFINQIREKIGVMFGNPETTSGGRALKFYASLRLDIRRIATLKESEVAFGHKTRIKAIKNKVGIPYREALVDLLFTGGFNIVGDRLDAAVVMGVVEKAGAWYSFLGERLGQGRDKTIEFLTVNPEILSKIKIGMEQRRITK
jgi:recombination protein RecA